METLPGSLRDINSTLYILLQDGAYRVAREGTIQPVGGQVNDDALPLAAYVPPVWPGHLGDPGFCHDHAVRLPYMTGAMANGIASTRLVTAIAGAGMLGSFGAAGLSLDQIEDALQALGRDLEGKSWCANLIHSPNEKGKEDATVDLYIKYGLPRVEASAYLALTLPVVRYRVHGIHQNGQGEIITPNRIIAKASRIEIANKWFSPPPQKMLQQLVDQGHISARQAELARCIPMAQDLTVEADSGGHTDNRPAITLLPTIMALRDRLQKEYAYAEPLRVGAAGGIATPASAAAAFAMGAAYIVTGTVNQACIESGSSDLVRNMLVQAEQADVAMAPAVDMFEMGVKLQVLKRGTMFPMRANKLYEYYRAYNSVEEIPEQERQQLEKTVFRAPLAEIWQNTRSFFLARDPEQLNRAGQDPKHRMALMFRWYLGLSSRWANAGEASRQADYQIWCGPAMGAFNEWTRGSFLEAVDQRRVVTVALNIMYGAAVVTRMNILRNQGIAVPVSCCSVAPERADKIESYLK
jgi:PfaD family protein